MARQPRQQSQATAAQNAPQQAAPEAEEMADERPREGIFKKLEKFAHYWNTPFKNKWTLGNLWARVTFRDPPEEKASKAARIVERVAFAAGCLFVLSMGGAGVAPLLGFAAAKLAAATLGVGVMHVGAFFEGAFRALDKKFGPEARERAGAEQSEDLVGARNAPKGEPPLEHPAGTRMGMGQEQQAQMQREEPVGARSQLAEAQSIKPQFDGSAADTRASRKFNPSGPAPAAVFGLKEPKYK